MRYFLLIYLLLVVLVVGVAGRRGSMSRHPPIEVFPDMHDSKPPRKVVQQPDGEIFNTITYGKPLMGAYGPDITVEDRWAIIAYVRALQRSRLASLEDVPAEQRPALTKPLPPGPAPKK